MESEEAESQDGSRNGGEEPVLLHPDPIEESEMGMRPYGRAWLRFPDAGLSKAPLISGSIADSESPEVGRGDAASATCSADTQMMASGATEWTHKRLPCANAALR
jgi:hypothetical protein